MNLRVLRFPSSGTINEVRYNLATGEMVIQFLSTRSSWSFADVEPGDFALLCLAESPGAVFNQRIRGRYQGRRTHPKAS
jgi:hypothetical protein